MGPSESMSKSKKNTIDPEIMIKNFGADSVRFFILSDSPPEKDVQWSDQGMLASFKFTQKFWSLSVEFKEKLKKETKDKTTQNKINDDMSTFTNQIIKKITFNLENFHYNVLIANFHEIYNFLNKIKNSEILNTENFKENYIKILIVMNPVLPHLISECLADLNIKDTSFWPEIDEKYLEEKSVNIVIQINGKKRDLINCDKDISEDELFKKISKNADLKKYFINKKIIKKIYVKNKIINLILK